MTNKEKVLCILIREKTWLPTYEFQNRHGIFVGHRGPARISELQKEYPYMVEVEQIPGKRTYQYRFRSENTLDFLPKLSPEMRKLVETEMKQSGILYQKVVRRTVIDNVNRTARIVEEIITN